LIVGGKVKITKEGKEQSNSPLLEGDYFGEISLMTEEPRKATLTAIGDIKVVYLEREAFNRLMGSCQEVLERNMEKYKNAVEKKEGN
jgi:cAMP-dependent protein kinase regulator